MRHESRAGWRREVSVVINPRIEATSGFEVSDLR